MLLAPSPIAVIFRRIVFRIAHRFSSMAFFLQTPTWKGLQVPGAPLRSEIFVARTTCFAFIRCYYPQSQSPIPFCTRLLQA